MGNIVPNGTIEVITNEGFGSVGYTEERTGAWYTFTPNQDTSSIIVTIPGIGGGGLATASNYADYVKDNPAYIAVFNSSGGSDWNKGLSDAISSFNAPVGSTLDLYTFSAGTISGMNGTLIEANRKTDNGQNFYDQINVHIIDTGTYGTGQYNKISDENIALLSDANVNVIFEPHSGYYSTGCLNPKGVMDQPSVQKMVEGGVNVFIVAPPTEDHVKTCKYVLSNLLPIMQGQENEEMLNTFNILVPQRNRDGSLLRDENGNIIWDAPTEEDLQILLPDIYTKSFKERYDTLDKLSRYRSLDSTCVASDLYEVYDNMLSINKEIITTNAIYENSENNFENGTSTIPSNLSKSTDALFGITKSVMTNLSTDTEAICSIAEYIYQMDQELCANATVLGDDLKGLISDLKTSENYTNFDTEITTLNLNLNSANTEVFNSNIEKGNAGRANANEILGTLTPLLNSLDSEYNDATKMSQTLRSVSSSFGSGHLLGEIWTKTADTLEEYICLMEVRGDAAKTLTDALKIASAIILEYMDPDTELDDSKLPELYIALANIKASLDGAKRTLDYARSHPYKETVDEETGEKISSGYTSSQVASYENTYNYYLELYNELDKEITKLEGLAEVMNTANKIIEEAISAIKTSYGTATTKVGGIRKVVYPSEIINYKNIMGESFDSTKYLDYYNTKYETYLKEGGLKEPEKEEPVKAPITSGTQGGSPSTPITPSNPDKPAELEKNVKSEKTAEPDKSVESEKTAEPDKPVESEKPEEKKEEVTPIEIKVPEEEASVDPNIEVFVNEEETKSPQKTNVNTKPSMSSNPASQKETVIPQEETVIPQEEIELVELTKSIEPEPVINPDFFTEIEDNTNTIEDPVFVNTNSMNTIYNNRTDTGKTLGIASGIGAVVGAAALGTHAITSKNNAKEESKSDYGYE